MLTASSSSSSSESEERPPSSWHLIATGRPGRDRMVPIPSVYKSKEEVH